MTTPDGSGNAAKHHAWGNRDNWGLCSVDHSVHLFASGRVLIHMPQVPGEERRGRWWVTLPEGRTHTLHAPGSPIDPPMPRRRHQPLVFRRQLTQHIMQDAAVTQVIPFHIGIHPYDGFEVGALALGIHRADCHLARLLFQR